MTIYVAYNVGMETTVQTVNGGQSLATGAKVTLQLGIPSGGQIEILEYGVSMDASAAATPAAVMLGSTATATTLGTAHSTTTVKPLLDPNAVASRLTMSTSTTAFGATIPASRTTLRVADRQYVPPTGQYVKLWPLGLWPKFGATGAAEYLQLILNTSATVNVLGYIVFNELI